VRDAETSTGGGPSGRSPSPADLGAAAQVFVADLEALTMEPNDEHHLEHVLRLRRGELVVASDGAGQWRACRFTGPAPARAARSAPLEADGPVMTSTRPKPGVTVAFVAAKGDRPEWVVQKLTEAGVDRIVVLGSVRAVVRWEGERRTKAMERLRRVARHAAAQSRRPWLAEVDAVSDLDRLADQVAPLPLALAQFGGDPPNLRAPVVAVGPEGGWDPSETASGRLLVGLGPTVLRAETAAISAGLLLCALRQGLVEPASRAPKAPRTA
jgi:16S rRNA (uracil1498-N3)-methyltransferase